MTDASNPYLVRTVIWTRGNLCTSDELIGVIPISEGSDSFESSAFQLPLPSKGILTFLPHRALFQPD